MDDGNPAGTPETRALAFLPQKALDLRKKRGIFYTPLEVVDDILSSTLAPAFKASSIEEILSYSVLDPSCGSGVFLIRAFRMYMQELTARGKENARLAPDVLSHCIFGVDHDADAVTLARELLLDCCREYSPQDFDRVSPNVRHGNSLIDPDALGLLFISDGLKPFSWKENFPAIFEKGGFDFVIGNPPYGLSRGDQISPQENVLLRRRFQEATCGKLNKYLAFMALGFDLLNLRGILSFVVPNSWLGIRDGSAIRELLLKQGDLKSITLYDYPVFGDPSVETLVFRVEKCGPTRSIEINHRSSAQAEIVHSHKLPAKICLNDPELKIPLRWRSGIQPLLEKLNSPSLKVGDQDSPFLPLITLQAYSTGKGEPPQTAEQVKNHAFHSLKPDPGKAFPYLEGKDVGRYRVSWSGKYLYHGKFLAEPQTIDRFTGPRVIVREILGSSLKVLQAAYTEETFLYNKSVLHLLAKSPGQEDAMLALCALLNSTLISFFIRTCGCKSQRKLFPKIVNDDLKRIPLSGKFLAAVPALAALCRRRIAADSDSMDSEYIEQELERLCFTAFDFGAEEQQQIKQFLLST